MSSQHLNVHPIPPLDAYFNGIRNEFDRLNKELDEARKQRDEYKINYRKEKELREFIATLLQRLDNKNQSCRHFRGDITRTAGLADDIPAISPPSLSSDYYPPLEEKGGVADRLDKTENSIEISLVEEEQNQDGDVREGAISAKNEDPSTIPGITSLSLQSDKVFTNEVGKAGWEIIGETEIALKLDQVQRTHRPRAAFSPDGKYLAIICVDVAWIIDMNTGEMISVMRDLYKNTGMGPFNTCLDFSPDNKYLATGDTSGKVRIWIISQKRVRNMFRLPGYITDLQFSPNGQQLVTSTDRTVRIWRLRDGSSTVLADGGYLSRAVRFNRDGRYVASGYGPGQILILDVRTRRSVARWEGHSEAVSSLVFTPDGKGLLTASWDKTVVYWDIAWLSLSWDNAEGKQDVNSTVTEISRFVDTVGVLQVAISPDGKWIASRSYNKFVRIWNTHDATLQCRLLGPSEASSVAFSPVGTYFAIGGDLPKVTVWNYACTAVSPL